MQAMASTGISETETRMVEVIWHLLNENVARIICRYADIIKEMELNLHLFTKRSEPEPKRVYLMTPHRFANH
jgi:hypothetical protein